MGAYFGVRPISEFNAVAHAPRSAISDGKRGAEKDTGDDQDKRRVGRDDMREFQR
jgi:hypothetical protein